MPITKLIVGGFKSLRDRVEIPLAPITLMFGPNSAGKSSVKDAWQELRRKLKLSSKPNDAKTRAMVSRMVSRPDSRAYKDPAMLGIAEDDDNFTRHRVILGCEVTNFSSEYISPNESISALGKSAGQHAFRDLDGSTVEMEIADDPQDVSAAFAITVDGSIAFRYFDYLTAATSGLIDINDLASPNIHCSNSLLANPSQLRPSVVGVLMLDLSTRPFKSPEMLDVIQRLLKLVKKENDEWLDKAIGVSENNLVIRIDAPGRRLIDWFEMYSDTGDPLTNFAAPFIEVAKEVAILVNALNEFIYQVESTLIDELTFAQVPGGRPLLTKDSLKSSTHRKIINVALPRLEYPIWLGVREAGYDINTHFFGASKSNPDRDFVNESLAGALFGSKKYRFKSELSKTVRTRISDRNEENIGDEETELDSQLYLIDEHGRQMDIEEVGSGVSYVYPVLTALWRASRSWIEQPELHLHPAAQCEMGDIIVKAFNIGSFSAIETHSEHLLLRILRRIRETSAGKVQDRELACQPEAVAVLYFAPQEDGSTQVHQLRVTRGGDFMDRWPDGFFEERSRELFDE